MEILAKQIRRARQRLLFEQFLAVLSWTWFAGLVIAVIGIAAGKIWPTDFETLPWAVSWIAGGSVAGIVAAIVWTAVRAQSA